MSLKTPISILVFIRASVSLLVVTFVLSGYATDTDLDGLPDDWEIENGRNPNLADYQVSAGEFHTCAIDDDGVKCWSKIDPPTQFSIDSDVGQIDVPPLENPFLLSAGRNRSCAVDDTGVVCWGRNTDSGNNGPSLLNPKELAIATDDASVCAIDDSGIVCWGDGNTYGQITPPDITNPRGLTAGNVHFCAIGDEGAQCWGFSDNDYTDMSSLTNPSYISTGVGSTCAIDDSGVVCFGYINNWDIPTLSNPLIVEVGTSSACAIDDTGVHCWGTDAYSGSKLLEVPTLLNPHNLTINKTATLGYHHACSVTDEGVICWGHNQVGQVNVPVLSLDPDGDGYNNQGGLDTFPLDSSQWIDTDSDGIGNNSDDDGNNADTDDDGDGIHDLLDEFPLDYRYSNDIDQDGMPDEYEDIYGLNKYAHTDALSDMDEDGLTALQEFDLGTSPISSDTDNDTLPDGWEVENNRDPLLSDYRVETNGNVACAVDDTGVVCWGWDLFLRHAPDLTNATQVGVGQHDYCALVGTDVLCWGGYNFVNSSLNNPTQLSLGSDHSCVLDDTGVICWREMNVELPVPDTLINPRYLSAGSGDTCVIDDTGLVCWDTVGNIHTIIPELVNPKQVSLGGYFNCALDDTGVVCWDDSGNIQTNVPELTNPMQVAVGSSHACAIDDTGLVCWGANNHGQTSVPSSLRKPIQVSAGEGQTCILDVTGPVCWGYYASTNDIPSLLIDPDEDGYNSQNGIDAFPYDPNEWLDTDSDGIGNNADLDDDNDGINDLDDTSPLVPFDSDADGVSDNEDAFPNDPSETTDTDQDSIGDNADNCLEISNSNQLNTDGDDLGDACDNDDDNDGIQDNLDVFPIDATEQLDSDGDGIGNNADLDDDNDQYEDVTDAFPLNQRYHLDSDSDGMADAWEVLYGLNPNDPLDTISDQDNDGSVALQEFIEGTIPRPDVVSNQNSWDFDNDGVADPLTDGLLLLRYIFNLKGIALTDRAISFDSQITPEMVEANVADAAASFADIDGNGEVDALTDGSLLIRYLFNLNGESLVIGAIGNGAERSSSKDIEDYIISHMP